MTKKNQATFSLGNFTEKPTRSSKRDAIFLGIGLMFGLVAMSTLFHQSPDMFDYIVYVFGGFFS